MSRSGLYVSAALLLLLVAACVRQDSDSIIFVDDFDRPNTVAGLGDGWDMRGASRHEYSLPPATDGFIQNGAFTYAGDSIVYAVRQFPDTVVRRAGAEGMWVNVREGADTAIGIVLTANDRIISDMVHLAATRDKWTLSTRRDNGDFRYISQAKFDPPLQLGRSYRFDIATTKDAIIVDVPGHTETIKLSTSGLVGDRAFWEEYFDPKSGFAGTVFKFDRVWAGK